MKPGDIATARLATAAATSRPTSNVRRSIRGRIMAMVGAVAAPAIAVAATASPAVPSLIPTSRAIVGSTPAGRNSLETRIAIPAASATTGAARPWEELVEDGVVSGEVVVTLRSSPRSERPR